MRVCGHSLYSERRLSLICILGLRFINVDFDHDLAGVWFELLAFKKNVKISSGELEAFQQYMYLYEFPAIGYI